MTRTRTRRREEEDEDDEDEDDDEGEEEEDNDSEDEDEVMGIDEEEEDNDNSGAGGTCGRNGSCEIEDPDILRRFQKGEKARSRPDDVAKTLKRVQNLAGVNHDDEDDMGLRVYAEFAAKCDPEMLAAMASIGPCQTSYLGILAEAFLDWAIKQLSASTRKKLTLASFGRALRLLINIYCSTAFKGNKGRDVDTSNMSVVETAAQKYMGKPAAHLSSTGQALREKMKAFAIMFKRIFKSDNALAQELDKIIPGLSAIFYDLTMSEDVLGGLVDALAKCGTLRGLAPRRRSNGSLAKMVENEDKDWYGRSCCSCFWPCGSRRRRFS